MEDPFEVEAKSRPYTSLPTAKSEKKAAAEKRQRNASSDSQKQTSKYTIVVTGCSGRGKSTFCNFLFKEKRFKAEDPTESGYVGWEGMASTPSGAQYDKVSDPATGVELHIIDTPGYLATQNRTGNDREDLAKDGNMVLKEFAKALMYARDGIDAICVTLKAGERISKEEELLMQFIERLHLWKYCILLFTHGSRVGHDEDSRYHGFHQMIKKESFSKDCPVLAKMLDLTTKRFVIVESVTQAGDEVYYRSKLEEICSAIKVVREDVGIAINHPLLQMARNAWDAHQIQEKIEEKLKKGEAENKVLKRGLESMDEELTKVKRQYVRTQELTQRLEACRVQPSDKDQGDDESPSDPVRILVNYLKGLEDNPAHVADVFSQLSAKAEEQKQLKEEILKEISQSGKLGFIYKKNFQQRITSLMNSDDDRPSLHEDRVQDVVESSGSVAINVPDEQENPSILRTEAPNQARKTCKFL
jgi:GTP-binding protein EngB required for normal cell division